VEKSDSKLEELSEKEIKYKNIENEK